MMRLDVGLLLMLMAMLLCGVHGASYEVQMVQMLHRHGARSAIASYNETQICGYEYPCGFLNRDGVKMMTKVGNFIRGRYQTLFPSEKYNASQIYTRSTDVIRTLQSADAVLQGLFPAEPYFLPAIHTVRGDTDTLLNSGALPVIRAKYVFGTEDDLAVCNPVVDKHFSHDLLLEIAREVYSEGFCADFKNRASCAKQLCDIGRAYVPTGEIARHKKLSEHLEHLCEVEEVSGLYHYAYDGRNKVDRLQGSMGQNIAQQIIQNMNDHLQGTISFSLMEYSAHDTTLSPLSSTLGDNSLASMLPPFGTTYFFELLRVVGSGDKTPYVRVIRGYPGKTRDTKFAFALDDFNLQCTDARGKSYGAEDNVCPLADFVRYVNASRPKSREGQCYINPPLLKKMACPATAKAKGISSECSFYRSACPQYSCGKGYILDAVSNECYIGGAPSSGSSVLTFLFVFLLGMIGACAGYMAYNTWFITPTNPSAPATDVAVV